MYIYFHSDPVCNFVLRSNISSGIARIQLYNKFIYNGLNTILWYYNREELNVLQIT